MSYRMLFVYTFISAAVISDYRYFKIPNILNLWGLITAIFLNMILGISGNLPSVLLGFAMPFLFLYPVFILGGIGAGDVKLLCIIGAITGLKSCIRFIVLCLVVAVIIGIIKLLLPHKNKEKFSLKRKIHFSYAILAASILDPIINNSNLIHKGGFL